MQYDIQNNGIGVFDGYFSKQFCDSLIEHFEWYRENGYTWGRADPEIYRSDNSVTLDSTRFIGTDNSNLLAEFNSKFFEECYHLYCKKFSVIDQLGRHGIYGYKIQKTLPSEGYHIWHCEQSSVDNCRRLGVYLLYLNDVDEGGETEFLYLSQRIKPQTGRLVIFPAGYVHAHRGNPPLVGEKYILTGWLEFQ